MPFLDAFLNSASASEAQGTGSRPSAFIFLILLSAAGKSALLAAIKNGFALVRSTLQNWSMSFSVHATSFFEDKPDAWTAFVIVCSFIARPDKRFARSCSSF
jgi:hypothetical protein